MRRQQKVEGCCTTQDDDQESLENNRDTPDAIRGNSLGLMGMRVL